MNDRPIHHVSYIVHDIPKAVDQWVDAIGAGPFFHLGEHVEFDEKLLEGEPCVSITPRRRQVGPDLPRADRAPRGHPGARVAPLHRRCRWQQHRPYRLHRRRPCRRERAPGGRRDAQVPEFAPRAFQISFHDAPLLGRAIEVHENTDAINELFALSRSRSEPIAGTASSSVWQEAAASCLRISPAAGGESTGRRRRHSSIAFGVEASIGELQERSSSRRRGGFTPGESRTSAHARTADPDNRDVGSICGGARKNRYAQPFCG
jgi:hypothetical protein